MPPNEEKNNRKNDVMDKIISLCKRRGFVYSGSEIYGGLANTWDYGPVGTELLRNIRNGFWDNFVEKRTDIVGLDAGIISHKNIWVASGHATSFTDVMIDCKNCKMRTRADHLIESFFEKKNEKFNAEGKEPDVLAEVIKAEGITCPNCGKKVWSPVRRFNLMFPVNLGIVEESQSLAYLRGETAQGMFINFKNVLDSNRLRLPFGIAQVGKSFRNEITKGNFVFRTVEFEQGEIEYFFNPEATDWNALFEDWKKEMFNFVTKILGVREENLRWRVHGDEERSFYSKRTEDLEYNFPFGFKELWGIAYRTDYDLNQHIKYSGVDLSYTDPVTNKKFVPHVIEPAVGINRLFLITLLDAYREEGAGDDKRVYLKLPPKVAPFKAAVFPLMANKPDLVAKAKEIFDDLRQNFRLAWDDRGNVGKRYYSQDEIGTPYCVTVDFDTLNDKAVTVRDRDTMKQERVAISELKDYMTEKLST